MVSVKKKIILVPLSVILCVFISCSTTEEAQNSSGSQKELEGLNQRKVEKKPEYVKVQRLPKLKGGLEKLMSHLQYPKKCQEARVQGTVIVGFIVTETGSLTSLEVVKGIGHGCDETALRLIREFAEYNPGIAQGKPAKFRMEIPIVFKAR